MRARIGARGQTLSVEIADVMPLVWADERAFKQMLLNLLSNAAKFSPEGGHIGLRCRELAQGGIEICVSDDGPGIAPDRLAQVFEPFSQIDNRFDAKPAAPGWAWRWCRA